MNPADLAPPEDAILAFYAQKNLWQQKWQKILDDMTLYVVYRWIACGILSFLYVLRVLIINGYYIVTYALAIYLLNLFIAFLTPKIDPTHELENDDELAEEGPTLPTKADEEFRPFIRRLPEFKFWYSTTKAFLVAFICTFFSIFDVPVFWPILLLYFCILFYVTMKRQIRHMIKYRYLPFNLGKRVYKDKPK
jgi:hypothetical protein